MCPVASLPSVTIPATSCLGLSEKYSLIPEESTIPKISSHMETTWLATQCHYTHVHTKCILQYYKNHSINDLHNFIILQCC